MADFTREEMEENARKFERADLRNIDLRGAKLVRIDLTGANLSGANLSRVILNSANLRRADLREANLANADLRGADLSNADMRGANLRAADLRGYDLSGVKDKRGAKMRGVVFGGKVFSMHGGIVSDDAKLTGTNLSGAKYNKATIWHKGFRKKARGAILVDDDD